MHSYWIANWFFTSSILSLPWWCFTDQPAGGFVHIAGEELEESKFDIDMKLYAKKLDKKDFFGKVTTTTYVLILEYFSQAFGLVLHIAVSTLATMQ